MHTIKVRSRLLLWLAGTLWVGLLSCNLPQGEANVPLAVDQGDETVLETPLPSATGSAGDGFSLELQTGTPIQVASTALDASGGTLRVDQADSPLEGMTISAPAGAYTRSVEFTVSSAEILTHNLDPDLRPVTPLITIDNGDILADEYLDISIPVQLEPNEFAMVFVIDGATGKMDALPLTATSTTQLKAITRRFSTIMGVAIDRDKLDKLNLATGFRHGVDNWQFTNYGSAVVPGGHCAGQTLTALYFFDRIHAGQLYGQFDAYDNTVYSTPNWQVDDRLGYRLASTAQDKLDWESEGRQFWTKLQDEASGDLNSDEISYYSFALALRASREPQFIYINGTKGAHAMIVYAKYADRFYIDDPNYPSPVARRVVIFDRANRKFKPYYSGPNAADLGHPFTEIRYYSKHTLLSDTRLEALFAEFYAGTVGEDVFPEYALIEYMRNADGSAVILGKIDSQVVITTNPVLVTIAASFDPFVEVFRVGSRRRDNILNKSLAARLQINGGREDLAFIIYEKKDGKLNWVDGRWITFIDSYEGEWNSGPRCGESFETPYRWSVYLIQADDGTLSGTIHFHNCPGGGQVYYHVTGVYRTGQSGVVLDGFKAGGAGDLDKNSPEIQTFTFIKGGSPQPNFAP